MKSFEEKAREVFAEIIINKSFIHQAGFGARAIPTYVGEWIISYFVGDSESIDEQSRGKIASFISKFVPAKGEKENINNQLLEMQDVQMLDNYNVSINLTKGDRFLSIPFLDLNNAAIPAKIVEENEMLLSSGLWGVGTLFYIPPTEESPKGQVWMKEFKPFQIANVDIDYYNASRSSFSTDEWIDFIISSMGFNPEIYSNRQKILLISRLIPLVEPRYNLVELAPKGTGKSYVYDNMSRYVAVRAGNITPAVLFFNDARKTAGLITKYDAVVIDEAQKVKGDSSGELTALLKTYLESGKFGKGTASAISADAGIVILANIELDENTRPLNELKGLFKVFPNFLQETAFIDRFSGFLPGWDLPRVTKTTPSKFIGLKGDIFGEILHRLRLDIGYRDYVKTNMKLIDCEDMRDNKAIEAGASGLMKIIFPNKLLSEAEFYQYCVNPAIELRQRVRDELCKMDREYFPVTIRSSFPDDFQTSHHKPSFYSDEGFNAGKEEANDDKLIVLEEENIIADDDISIMNIIGGGEGSMIEFKSTLRFNLLANKNDKEITYAVLKTVSAFLNSDGGTLFIGISDEGKIVGIEKDNFDSSDKFLVHLYNHLKSSFGQIIASSIKTKIHKLEEGTICEVNCPKSLEPVYLKFDYKEDFYIRSGPTSEKLQLSMVHKYIGEHFKFNK